MAWLANWSNAADHKLRHLWQWHAACTWAVTRDKSTKKSWHLQAASQYAASRPCALINIVSWPYISWCLSGSRVPLIHWLIIIFRRIENDGHKWGSITHFQSNCNFSPKENLRWARAMLLSQMHQNGRGGGETNQNYCSAVPAWAFVAFSLLLCLDLLAVTISLGKCACGDLQAKMYTHTWI